MKERAKAEAPAASTTGIRYLTDPRVSVGTAWITGPNVAGDPAPDGSGPVELARGMEIGHVFQLGRKYAEVLGLKVLDENGKLVTVTMGSYGIGVTRILAVIAEANNDAKGLIWPKNVAPYDLHVIAATKEPEVHAVAEALVTELEGLRYDVLFDDRLKVSPGVKFGDAELIGVPTIIIVGKGVADGMVELWDRRSNERTPVAIAGVAAAVAARG